jgi:DNA invertase Pin-like site-specific DNA recombinase
LVDDGKSASKAEHIGEGGQLAKFIDGVKSGKIPRCTLIVESLDRLSRQAVPIALGQFLQILNLGVEIVTLIDGQWYSQKSLEKDSMPLMMSIVIMMRAYDESDHKAYRLSELWMRKRQRAVESKTPVSPICPGWLEYDKEKKFFRPIAQRVKKVRLIYRLWNRGWGRHRIAKLFNKHEVPHWGKKKRHSEGWHHSYISKILQSRAVLGEYEPHSTKDQGDLKAIATKRKPVAAPIPGYYPTIITEATFMQAQARRAGSRGPLGKKGVSNLFQGLLKDGEHSRFTMCYRDHGSGWKYVVSDFRRVNVEAPLFSWKYEDLEKTILGYISDLDWSSLTESKSAEIRKLREDLSVLEGKMKGLNKDMNGMLELSKVAQNIPELAAKVQGVEAERQSLRSSASKIKTEIKNIEGFLAIDAGNLIRGLAKANTYASRYQLRTAIRQNIERIELFRKAPAEFISDSSKSFLAQRMADSRAIKLVFSNGVVRWITVLQGITGKLDGKMPEEVAIVSGVVTDMRKLEQTALELRKLRKAKI